MAGIGSILSVLGTSGSITAPTTLDVSVGSDLSTTVAPYGLFDWCPMNALRGCFFAHATEAMWHTVEGVRYRTGLMAPNAAQTLASTGGAKASATLTFASQPADGDSIIVGHPARARKVTFKTTLVTSGLFVGCQVLRGANLAAAISNLQKLVNATGIHGTDYFNDQQHLVKTSTAFKFTDAGNADVSVTSTTGTTAVFTCGSPGTLGNSYKASYTSSGAQITSFGTSSLMTGGTAGTGTDPGVGIFRYNYAHYRAGDRAQSGASETGTIQKSNNGNVNQTAFVDAPTRDATTHFRWQRTQQGALTYYKGADVAVADAEPYTDSVSDASLIGAFALLYDPSLYRPYAAGYPQVVRYVCNFKDRIFGVGAVLAADYTNGTAAVTNGSAAVTLSAAAHPKENWIGREFKVTGDAQTYTILEVVESTRVLTLHGAYQGTTAAAGTYTVRDQRDPFEVFWTEPGLPNNWPLFNSVKGVSSKDTRGGTGIRPLWDAIAVWTWTGLWKVEGAGGVGFRILPISEGMGAFCNQAIQTVNGTYFWLGPDGVFAWGGEGMPENLSNPAASSARGIADTIRRINVDAAEQVVSDYNPSQKRIMWFVPVDGEERNRMVIVYDLQTGAFSTDTCEETTAAISVSDPTDGVYRTVTGDSTGNLWQHDLSTSDGAYGFEVVTTETGYATATKTVTCPAAAYPTSGSGLKGVPVVKVDATGVVEFAKVATNTGTTLVLCSPFTTAPAVGDKIIPGGIAFDIQSGRFDFQRPDILKKLVWVTAAFQTSTAGRLFVAAGIDNSDPTVLGTAYADLTNTDGEYLAWFRRGKFRRCAFRFLDVVPGHELNLLGYVPKMASTA